MELCDALLFLLLLLREHGGTDRAIVAEVDEEIDKATNWSEIKVSERLAGVLVRIRSELLCCIMYVRVTAMANSACTDIVLLLWRALCCGLTWYWQGTRLKNIKH